MNADLLLRVADVIEAQPERYNQRTYGDITACGTAHCVAGWTIMLALPEALRITTNVGSVGFDRNVLDALTGERNVHSSAQKLLDLTDAEAERLFEGKNGPLLKKDSPATALRKIAAGKRLSRVWGPLAEGEGE